jgi:membrane associated rhomboid family serine protease
VTPIFGYYERRRQPIVNYALIAVNVLVFIYQLTLGGINEDIFIWKFGLIPAELTRGVEFTLGPFGANIDSPIPTWGTVFSSMFIHGSILHIVTNMLFLWGFGDRLEDKLGHVLYLLFYLGAGVAAAWTQVAVDLDSVSVLIGASGAIFGVVGAYLLAFPYRNTIPLVIVFFLLPLVFGNLSPSLVGGRIAYMAHVGGFVTGILFMAGYKFLAREPILPRGPRLPGL